MTTDQYGMPRIVITPPTISGLVGDQIPLPPETTAGAPSPLAGAVASLLGPDVKADELGAAPQKPVPLVDVPFKIVGGLIDAIAGVFKR